MNSNRVDKFRNLPENHAWHVFVAQLDFVIQLNYLLFLVKIFRQERFYYRFSYYRFRYFAVGLEREAQALII